MRYTARIGINAFRLVGSSIRITRSFPLAMSRGEAILKGACGPVYATLLRPARKLAFAGMRSQQYRVFDGEARRFNLY